MGQDARANKLKPTECLYAHERKDMQKKIMCLRCIEITMFNIIITSNEHQASVPIAKIIK